MHLISLIKTLLIPSSVSWYHSPGASASVCRSEGRMPFCFMLMKSNKQIMDTVMHRDTHSA